MEGGDVNNKQQGRDRGALGGSHGDGRKYFRGTMEEEPRLPVGEEAAHPGNDVPMYAFGSKRSCELGRVDIVKASFDV